MSHHFKDGLTVGFCVGYSENRGRFGKAAMLQQRKRMCPVKTDPHIGPRVRRLSFIIGNNIRRHEKALVLPERKVPVIDKIVSLSFQNEVDDVIPSDRGTKKLGRLTVFVAAGNEEQLFRIGFAVHDKLIIHNGLPPVIFARDRA